jgi:hypothetical protein
VIDACHSDASVNEAGFKPGPFGSKGLGQLAFDKRMRVIAASTATGKAQEHSDLRHGVLTYALVIEGIRDEKADNSPPDGKIGLGEWLMYGRDRVPALANGLVSARDRREAAPVAKEPLQRSVLYDFSKGTREQLRLLSIVER